MAGDVLAALLLSAELRIEGAVPAQSPEEQHCFLNPLLLDNSALYGRFDSLGCALLLLALRGVRRTGALTQRDAVYYALAVAVKTFPAFVIFGLWRSSRSARACLMAALAVVLGVVSLPYLGSLRPYLRDILLYNAGKDPQGLSWQQVFLQPIGGQQARLISYAFLGLLVAGAWWLSSRIGDLASYTLLTLLLFILCSKVVLSHYLIWSMPWLIVAMCPARSRMRRGSALLLALFTVTGLQMNPYFHPFGQYPVAASYVVAIATAAYVGTSVAANAT